MLTVWFFSDNRIVLAIFVTLVFVSVIMMLDEKKNNFI